MKRQPENRGQRWTDRQQRLLGTMIDRDHGDWNGEGAESIAFDQVGDEPLLISKHGLGPLKSTTHTKVLYPESLLRAQFLPHIKAPEPGSEWLIVGGDMAAAIRAWTQAPARHAIRVRSCDDGEIKAEFVDDCEANHPDVAQTPIAFSDLLNFYSNCRRVPLAQEIENGCSRKSQRP